MELLSIIAVGISALTLIINIFVLRKNSNDEIKREINTLKTQVAVLQSELSNEKKVSGDYMDRTESVLDRILEKL